jgi:hypothetical protein
VGGELGLHLVSTTAAVVVTDVVGVEVWNGGAVSKGFITDWVGWPGAVTAAIDGSTFTSLKVEGSVLLA